VSVEIYPIINPTNITVNKNIYIIINYIYILNKKIKQQYNQSDHNI
jgi:hypothetical protein